MDPKTITHFQIVVLPETAYRDEEAQLFVLDDQGRLFWREIAIGGKPVMDEWQEVLL